MLSSQLVLLAALAGTAVAAPFRALNATLTRAAKRDWENERMTWYNPSVGLGACGKQFQDSDFVRAAATSVH